LEQHYFSGQTYQEETKNNKNQSRMVSFCQIHYVDSFSSAQWNSRPLKPLLQLGLRPWRCW